MTTTQSQGIFLISLDVELLWGVRDKRGVDSYGRQILGGRQAVGRMLELFQHHGIRATWAAVGLLFFADKEALLQGLPDVRPAYLDPRISAYADLDAIGPDEAADPYHFGASLIDSIRACPGQELASHTFSHYYTLEPGQGADAFGADIRAAQAAAQARGVALKSLVFPRNQVNRACLPLLPLLGFQCFRGTENAFGRGKDGQRAITRFERAVRLLDSYLPLTGAHTYPLGAAGTKPPYNLRASAFLRPYRPGAPLLERLRLLRIKRCMTRAAKKGEVFHLWWHPHNLGAHLEENLAGLRCLLEHYQKLAQRYGMRSLSMSEAASQLDLLHAQESER